MDKSLSFQTLEEEIKNNHISYTFGELIRLSCYGGNPMENLHGNWFHTVGRRILLGITSEHSLDSEIYCIA